MKAIEEASSADHKTLRDAIVRQAQIIRALELAIAAAVFREKAVRSEFAALEDLVAAFALDAIKETRDPSVARAFVIAAEVAIERHNSRKKGIPP